MGFMAGFGPAFSEGLKKNQELREQRKDDTFKMVFADYEKNADARREEKKKDAQNVRKAKSLSESNNPAAWPKVYQWVSDGLSDEEIEKRLQGTFNVSATPSGATPRPAAAGSSAANPAATDSPKPAPAPRAQNAAQMATENAQGTMSSPSDNLASGSVASPSATINTSDTEPEEAMTGNNKFLSGMSGKFKSMPTRAQAAPGDVMVPDEARSRVPAPGNEVVGPARDSGGFGGFMRDAFGNGGGDQSRLDMINTSKQTIASGLGQNVDEAFGDYVPETPDTSNIQWTPAEAQEEPDKINTLEEAEIALANAKAANKDTTTAARRVESIKTAMMFKAEQEAMSKGISLDSKPVSVWDQNGKFVRLDRLDREGNGFDGKPLPEGYRTQPVTEQERKDEQEVMEKLEKPMGDYNAKVDNYVSVLRDIGELDKIYSETPIALQKVAASGSAYLQNMANEVAGVVDLFSPEVKESIIVGSPEGEVALQSLQTQARELANRVENDDVGRTANAAALAETKKSILAYKLGAMMGQTGRSLAQTELAVFQKVFDSSNLPQFRAKMGSLLDSGKAALDKEGRTLLKSGIIENFRANNNGRDPAALDTTSLEDKLIAERNDPLVAHALDLVEGNKPAGGAGRNVVREKVDSNMGTGSPVSEQPQIPDRTNPQGPIQLPQDPAQATTAYESLAPGTEYIDPQGIRRKKPAVPQPQ
jgi:hypothetical protein